MKSLLYLKKLFFLVLLLIGFTITAPASDTQKAHYWETQQDGRKITGKVIDENGETLIGVSVMVKETNMGIVTDVDGNYVLNNDQEGTLLSNTLNKFIKF